MITVNELLNTVPQTGRLEWIGLRTERHGPVISVHETEAITGIGLQGDRKAENPNPKSKRHVTLVQAEHLAVISSFMKQEIHPELLRRNLVVSGINLLALKNKKFYIGDVLLEGTGDCHPCSRMEENLGPGGYNSMRGHGGITAKILLGGIIQVGYTVSVI